TNDSGPMHLAALLRVPVVAIFGPTVPAFGYAPWPVGGTRHAVLGLDLPCRPCTPHGGARCPIGTHECMTGISVERVTADVLSLVGPHTVRP
ncbi:MAG: glycosyltransferase family 9 protein, partial [bacterium]